MRIENRMQLKLWREECKEKHQKETCRILICGGTGCLAGGSDKIYVRLKEMTAHMDNVSVKIGEEIAHVGLKMSGCHGFCEMGPLVRIEPYNYLYLKVKLEDCEEIFEKTVLHGEPVKRLMAVYMKLRKKSRFMQNRPVWCLKTADILMQSILRMP